MKILLQHLTSYIDLIALNLYVYKNQPFELLYRFWAFFNNFALHAVLLAQYLSVIKPAENMQNIKLMIQSHILIS